MSDESLSLLFALDYGLVMKVADGSLTMDPTEPNPKWLDELQSVGLAVCRSPKPLPPDLTGIELRMVPLGYQPQVIWTRPPKSKSDEGILPEPPGANETWQPGNQFGTPPPVNWGHVVHEAGQVIKVINGIKYVWKFLKWVPLE